MYAGTNQVASNACFHFFLPYLCLQLIDALTKCNFKQQSLFSRLKTKKKMWTFTQRAGRVDTESPGMITFTIVKFWKIQLF